MRRTTVLIIAFALTVAACGGDTVASTTTITTPPTSAPAATTTTAAPTTTTTTAAGFVAASDDGRVTIDISPSAMAADPGIEITRLDPADQPQELASLDIQPWVYALEPGALQFDVPVRMTLEIPFGEFAAQGFEGAVPLATMVTTGSDGTGWELLGDQTIRRDGDIVTISGTTDHFSRVAVLHEQVLIEARFVELGLDETATIGFDFLWSNGSPLGNPPLGNLNFAGTETDPIQVGYQDGMATLQCPPGVTGLAGDLSFDLELSAMEQTAGSDLLSAPRLTTINQTASRIDIGIDLVCRPTISTDGSVTLDISIDHPGGAEIVPGGDFLGGLSAMYLALNRAFPGLFVGLIQDTDGDGVISPQDTMFPPLAATVSGNTTMAVLPLYGYGDYFPYFLNGTPPAISSQVSVADGSTILLGGLARQETAVPALGQIPYLARVFSQESSTTDDVELVVFLTPQIVRESE